MKKVTEIVIILCCKYFLISSPDVRNRLKGHVTVLGMQIFQMCVVSNSLDVVLIYFSPSTYLINTAFTSF